MKNVMIIILLVSITSLTPVLVAQTSKNNYITGVVSNSSKLPVASVWVILRQDGKEVAKSLTGEDGKYYIGNMERGTYNLEVKQKDKFLFQKQVSLPKNRVYNIQLP